MSSSLAYTSLTLIMVFLLSSISHLQAKSANSNLVMISTPTISAAPAVLPDSSTASLPPSYQELSPDISPLLPSPSSGGMLQPTVPSSPSPPNPDNVLIGPDSAYAPDGALQDSAASRCFIFVGTVHKLALVFGVYCFWLFQALPY